MRNVKKQADNQLKPRPQLLKTKEGWQVTNGWIGDIYFEVAKQPSEKTIRIMHEFFYDMATGKLNNKESKAS